MRPWVLYKPLHGVGGGDVGTLRQGEAAPLGIQNTLAQRCLILDLHRAWPSATLPGHSSPVASCFTDTKGSLCLLSQARLGWCLLTQTWQGGRIPICSEVKSLGKAGQTGFLDSKSVLGKSLGACIFFTDPRAPSAGAAPSSIPKWEMEAGDRVISHTCRPHTGACAHACIMVSAHGNGRARKGECLPSALG